MIRFANGSLVAVALIALGISPGAAQNGGGESWGTIKGRIVWGGKDLPPKAKITVTQDKDHCLAKGDLYDNQFEVDPKNRGLKGVLVGLKAAPGKRLPIHPSLQEIKEKVVVLDQPRCLFIPRAIAMRQGQTLLARNSSPVPHSISWTGDGVINKGGNVVVPAMKDYPIKGLKAQPSPLSLGCSFHPWMKGQLMIYNHPYFAVTKADGSFEIKLAPGGNHRLTIFHEGIGWRLGAEGPRGAGEPITVKAGQVVDLGDLKMGK
jgi:hypothetical protein